MMGDCLRACLWTATLCGLVSTWTARAVTQACLAGHWPPCNAAASFKWLHKHGLSTCSTPGPTLVLGRQQGARERLPARLFPQEWVNLRTQEALEQEKGGKQRKVTADGRKKGAVRMQCCRASGW